MPFRALPLVAALLGLAPASAPRAAQIAADYGRCSFDVRYGPTGRASSQGLLLERDALPLSDASPSNYAQECRVRGAGSGALVTQLRFRNDAAAASPALVFFAFADPDGGFAAVPPTAQDVASASFAAAQTGAPEAFAIDDAALAISGAPGNLLADARSPGQLDSADACGGACDAMLGLQFEIGSLAPGESAVIELSHSETGYAHGARSLRAARADDSSLAFTYSGRSWKATPTTDADGDGVPTLVDGCPWQPNGAAHAEVPGVGNQADADSDGVGDACTCGDIDGDGRVGTSDADHLRAHLADPPGSPLSEAVKRKCNVLGQARACDVLDYAGLVRASAPGALLPGVLPVCSAAVAP